MSRWNEYGRTEILTLFTVLIVSFSGSLTAAVRYGFLADSFTQREIEGKYYGAIGGSMFIGFLMSYLTRTTELLLKRFTPKTLLQLDQCLNLLYPIGCILSYDYLDDKGWLVGVNIALRIYNGFLGYPRCLLLIDLTRSQFGDNFDSVNSLVQMCVYAGHGLGAAMGSTLYDGFGYEAPFYLVTAMLILPIGLTIFFIPNCCSIAKGRVKQDRASLTDTEETGCLGDDVTTSYGAIQGPQKPRDGLTWLIVLPLLSTMLVNIVYGYLQITVTPYLHQQFGLSISVSGMVLAVVAVGMMAGSLTSAWLLDGPKVTPYTQMSIGALSVGLGVLLMFPVQRITFLYNNSTYLAFPAAFLAGFGDPLITIASLKGMKEVQMMVMGRVTPDQEIFMGGTWLIGFLAFCFAGQGLAGLVTEYLEYWVVALMLCGLSGISFAISTGLQIRLRGHSY